MWHPCPECAKCLTPGRLYDPTPCTPCQTFLADMQQNPSASSLASKTWMKWNRTLVNRWKKNNVALYSPSNVRMLIWADSDLFQLVRGGASPYTSCHAPHPGTVWARWTGPKLRPFPPWTPSWIKIASRLCHMYDLWQVVRTKPQVLKYSIHLYLGLIWILFLVLTKGYSLFLLTAKLSRSIRRNTSGCSIQLCDAYFTVSQACFLTVFPTMN